MATSPVEFYEDEVETLINYGNKQKGSDYIIEIEGCKAIGTLTATCSPPLPGRHPVEDIAGRFGVNFSEPGAMRTGGMFPITIHETIKGDAFKEFAKAVEDCIDPNKRLTIRVYCSSEQGGTSALDMTYTHCFFDSEDGGFELDNEAKTTPANLSLNVHFAMRKRTNS